MDWQTKAFGVLIMGLALIGVYTAGVSQGKSDERLKAEKPTASHSKQRTSQCAAVNSLC